MNPVEYSEKARSLAIYCDNSPWAKFAYPALGLADEFGELLDKITLSHTYTKEDIAAELGDVLWYLVNVSEDAGTSFIDLLNMFVDIRITSFTQLGSYINVSSDIRPSIVRGPVHTGRIAGVAKKMIRDTNGVLTLEKLKIVHESLKEIIVCLYQIAWTWGINMDDVAQGNIKKLFSRKERGVLQGSGDNR